MEPGTTDQTNIPKITAVRTPIDVIMAPAKDEIESFTMEMHVAGDQKVLVHTNCQTVANRKTFTFGTDGKLNTPAGTTQGSDSRLKTDISPIPEEQIETFKNLSPKAYTLKSSGRPGIGLIAQDVQGTALEEVLVSEGADGMLSIDYTNLHGLEIAVIQSLIKQIETLQTEIGELKAHIKD